MLSSIVVVVGFGNVTLLVGFSHTRSEVADPSLITTIPKWAQLRET